MARERTFALFVVDVEMPGMSGLDFVAHTRADPALAATPAVLVTSRAAAEDRRRGLAAGARAYIVKGEFAQDDFSRCRSEVCRMTVSARTRVLVVDDSLTVRKHIVELLEADPAFEVVAEAGDGRAGDRALRAASPRRRDDGHDASGHERGRGDRMDHGVLPHADRHRVGLDQPRRGVPNVRRHRGGGRGRGVEARGEARRRLGRPVQVRSPYRGAHQGRDPPARPPPGAERHRTSARLERRRSARSFASSRLGRRPVALGRCGVS